jgi:predicted AlkP superfamily pyrophosphatase or phosphodiesterase
MASLHACGAHRTVVVIAAGLSLAHVHGGMPRTRAWAQRCGGVRPVRPPFPAVTCTAQADLLTGRSARHHGAVANGWMDRPSGEVRLWRQSNRLLRGPMVWERARERFAGLTVANMFGWFNMFSSADVAVTPRPQYAADGRKVPDILSIPASLRDRLVGELGAFPLFHFWGPRADIRSTEWIAQATARVMRWHDPALTLAYLPHLDYVLQREGPAGPGVPSALRELDRVLTFLIQACRERGARMILCSEYGVEAASRVVHPNRVLRQAGLLSVRHEFGGEALDLNASGAFAMCDHQVAHVYARDEAAVGRAREMLESLPGVERVLVGAERAELELDHERSGDLVMVAAPGAWFAYPWWTRDADAPDYARTVDIHRKPGYDPCELLLDRSPMAARAAAAWFLLKRRLGWRALLRLTPLEAGLVRGTHGRTALAPGLEPVLVAEGSFVPDDMWVPLRGVHDVILRHLSGEPA